MKKILILIGLFCCFWINFLKAEVVNQIVAVIGDEFLTLYELDELCKPYFERFVNSDLSLREKENLKNQIRKKFLDQWIEETVIKKEAQKYGISVSEKEVEEYLSQQIKEIGGKENLEKLLQKEGLNYEDYRAKLREDLLKFKFIQWQVREKVLIPEEDLMALYQQEIKKYEGEPQYWISILVIHGEKDLAEKIYNEILKGSEVEEILKNYKDSVQYIKNVVLKENELAPGFLKILKELNPGEWSSPLKGEKNYQILNLIKKSQGSPPSYTEMRETLYQELFLKKAQEFIEKWIKELKEKKYIKIYL